MDVDRRNEPLPIQPHSLGLCTDCLQTGFALSSGYNTYFLYMSRRYYIPRPNPALPVVLREAALVSELRQDLNRTSDQVGKLRDCLAVRKIAYQGFGCVDIGFQKFLLACFLA